MGDWDGLGWGALDTPGNAKRPGGGLVLPLPTVGGGGGLEGEMLLSQGWGSGGTDRGCQICALLLVFIGRKRKKVSDVLFKLSYC